MFLLDDVFKVAAELPGRARRERIVDAAAAAAHGRET